MQAGRQAGGLAGRQPLTFEMLPCIVLDGAAEHATLLESLAHQLKCGAVEPKSLAHVVSLLTRAHCLFRLNEVTRVQSHLSTCLHSDSTLQDLPSISERQRQREEQREGRRDLP